MANAEWISPSAGHHEARHGGTGDPLVSFVDHGRLETARPPVLEFHGHDGCAPTLQRSDLAGLGFALCSGRPRIPDLWDRSHDSAGAATPLARRILRDIADRLAGCLLLAMEKSSCGIRAIRVGARFGRSSYTRRSSQTSRLQSAFADTSPVCAGTPALKA